MEKSDFKKCELCELEVLYISKHHLIPQQKSKGMDRELRNATIGCCVPCSKQVHALFTHSEMKRQINTLTRLKNDSRVQNWITWRRKHATVEDIKYSGKH